MNIHFSKYTLVEARHLLEISVIQSDYNIQLTLERKVEKLSIETVPGGHLRAFGLTLMKTNFDDYQGIFVMDVQRNSRAAKTDLKVNNNLTLKNNMSPNFAFLSLLILHSEVIIIAQVWL